MAPKRLWINISRYEQIPLLMALFFICIFLATQSDVFLTSGNIMNILRQSSVQLIAALGMTVALLAGQVDLSIGSLVAVVGITSVTAYNSTGSVMLSILTGVIVGITVGLINGLLVTKTRINALIATLGMMSVLRGISYLSTNARAVQTEGDSLKLIGTGYVGPIPIPVLIAFIVLVIFFYLLNHTTFGRYVYAVGGNEKAAQSSGLPVVKIQILVFIICALTAAISGLITTGRLNSFQPTIGAGFELDVIAAVILGGTRLTGGEGTLSGTVLGVLILGVLSNGLVLMDVNSFWQEVIRGGVIIIAVVVDEFRKRRAFKKNRSGSLVNKDDKPALGANLEEATKVSN